MSSKHSTANVSVAIRRADDDAVLVLRGGTLPEFTVPLEARWQVVEPVNEAMAAIGMTVTTLRAAWSSGNLDRRLYEAVWVSGAIPAGASWVPADEVGDRLVGVARAIAAAIQAGALTPAAGDLQPWYAPGWFDGMMRWVDERLEDAGLRRRGPIRQIRSWGRSALLQADTDRGLVWAKEVPARFAHEIAVTGLLADLDPGLVPPIVAADPGANRLLLAHVDGPLLTAVADPDAWTATVVRLAETQRVLAAERDRLSVAGVAPAALETLAVAVPALLADDDLLRVGLDGGLSEAVAERLRAEAGAIVAACRDLAAAGVPDSLDHGDLSAAQVIVGEMGPVIFDWSDASITHPFLSLASFLGRPGSSLGPGREALVRAYLGPWSGVVDARAGEDACRLARIVMPIHLARLHRDRVLPGLEQRWEMDRVVPALLADLAVAL